MGSLGTGQQAAGHTPPQMEMRAEAPAFNPPKTQTKKWKKKGNDPPLHPAALAAAPPSQQKQMIGEKLFRAVTSM
eukprot:7061833-Lingulodinium_polyedra.AAC.1